ncbi:MAG: hypothetical protein E6X17_12685 [Sporomusaceae bacterium]|nr:hypothetical protein [Sporomusaceae bacterium]
MYDQFFGQFLLQKGLLTAEQLCRALGKETAARVKLGVLAIDKGWLSAAQVHELHTLQRSQDTRFGDLAVSKGYLTPAQVDELLQSQRSRHLSLSQAILDSGYLTLAELTPVLALYKAQAALARDEDGFDAVAQSVIALSSLESGQRERYSLYTGLFLRNAVRFLQTTPVLEAAGPLDQTASDWFISQVISIDGQQLQTGLLLPAATLVQLAAAYSGEPIEAVDELALDAAAEFLNLHNGMFSIAVVNRGGDARMMPQTVGKATLLPGPGLALSIVTALGRMQLVLAAGN